MNKNKTISWIKLLASAVLLAFNYYVFVVKNNFSPAGLNGIATMIQYKTGFSISFMSLLINIPLSIFAYFLIKKEFAWKTLLFSLVYSAAFLLLQKSDLDFIQYNAQGHDTIYPVILSGVISGVVYGTCFKNNGSTGGTDVLSRYINTVHPTINFFSVTFTLNAIVAFASIFVYSTDRLDYKPAALCIAYCFISSFVGNYLLKGTKAAFKFTVVTNHSEEILKEINSTLHHGATRVDAVGAYSGTSKELLICIVNKHQLSAFQSILSRYPDTFSFCEQVTEIFGNFKRIKRKYS